MVEPAKICEACPYPVQPPSLTDVDSLATVLGGSVRRWITPRRCVPRGKIQMRRCLEDARNLDLREGVSERYLYENARRLFFKES